MSLSRLIYISTARYDLQPSDFDAILSEARTGNAQNALTGLLLFNGSNFLQCLEGPRDAVETVFALICGDDRHSGVVRILAEAAPKRLFDDWRMAYGEVAALDGAQPRNAFRVTEDELDALLPAATPDTMRALLTSFNTMSPVAPRSPSQGRAHADAAAP